MENAQIAENMIRWALGKIGDSNYSGWCMSFIEDALEISNKIEIFGGDCAKESCNMYYDAIQFGEHPRHIGWVPLDRVLSQKSDR